MSATRVIQCQECGTDYETIRANTKYCAKCRLLIDLQYLGPRTEECWICKTKFAPLERKDCACGACCYQPQKYGTATCVYCHNERPQVRGGTPVCHVCARDPDTRGRFIIALRNGQISRRKEST